MSVRHLSSLFRPKSVAVIGASSADRTFGTVLMKNLLSGDFKGPIMPVNPKYKAVSGVLSYPDVKSLPVTPDLAVICTPPDSVVRTIAELGERGTHAAVICTAGICNAPGPDNSLLHSALLAEARKWNMRLLGPNSMGVAVPGHGLNASLSHTPVLPGKIAFVSQSAAVCASVLDWAKPKNIGFSHFISLGDALDTDFGDLLDYLGSDPYTRAILLYVESIHERRNFMSAARAAARNKPLVMIKAGRTEQASRAAKSHTGALAGADDVYDAAIRRAGALRVYDFDELFGAVETLARSRPLKGERLAILTNGGGVGIMAIDELVSRGGVMAELSEGTIEKLSSVLPPCWSHTNPVDIIGDADGDRYVKALKILAESGDCDAVLVMHAPTAVTSSGEIAQAVATAAKELSRFNVMTCWVGDEAVANARHLFHEAGVPSYDTPGHAVKAFLHLVEYRRNQVMLMEVPPSIAADFQPDAETARQLINQAIRSNPESSVLSESDSKALLAAYGIPVVRTIEAKTPADAGRIAEEMDCRVAIKINSPQITHKSDVGGVVLDLLGAFEVEKAANAMLERVKAAYPHVTIHGFTVQEMVRRSGAQELIVGVTTDPIFGPVILFGEGGVAVEVIHDSAVALPPLNMHLARELISRTRVSKLLEGYRGLSAANIDAICQTLVQLSQLVVENPDIAELDINPLFADSQGVLALDARVRVARFKGRLSDRLAIRPYPKDLEEVYVAPDGTEIMLRPIRPEDEPNHHVFVSKLTPEDIRFRFFGLVGELPHSEMARLTQIDYDREMAFVATWEKNGADETIGVVRTFTDPDNEKAEFAVVVRSDIKGLGLGKKLLTKMIDYCASRGTTEIIGQVLADNHRMLKFVEGLGFRRCGTEGDIVEVKLVLAERNAAAAQ